MNPTILIVDDFASVRLYHSSFLTRKGYRCLEATQGAEALTLLQQHRVDLVILDMMMPEMNGRQFLDKLAAQPALSGVAVLVITSDVAHARTVFRDVDRPVGILAKPVVPAAILERVKELLATAAPVPASGLPAHARES